MGHSLGNQRLPAARRAIKQNTLRRLKIKLAIQVRMSEGQLNSVMNHLNLVMQTPNVLIRHLGDLFQNKIFDVGLRNGFEGVARPIINEHLIPRADVLLRPQLVERCGNLEDAQIAHRIGDDDPRAAGEKLLNYSDIAEIAETTMLDDFLPLPEPNKRAGR